MAPPATLIGRGSDRRIKLVLVGEHGVGKTGVAQLVLGQGCIRRSAHSQKAQDVPATVGVDFACKAMQIDDKDPWPCRLHLWDTSGQERFQQLVESHLRDMTTGDAVVVVYDICDEMSFAAVDRWVSKARELARESPQIAILGTKLDKALQQGCRKISTEEGQCKADELGAVVFLETCGVAREETSADNDSAQRLFQRCMASLLRKCRAATPADVSLGASMPRPVQNGEGIEGGVAATNKSRWFWSKTPIAYVCRFPWRVGLKCFGFA